MNKTIMLLILIIGTIINSFSQTLCLEELKQTIESQSFIELNRLQQLIEKKEYENAIEFIMNSNIEKKNSLELLISKDKQYILSFDEFNELQELLKLSETLFSWWPIYEICDLNGQLIVKTQMCIPKNPTQIDLNKFIFPKTIEDITDKCIAEKLLTRTIYKSNTNGEKAPSMESIGKLNYYKYGQEVAISYIIHPISGKSIVYSDTRIKSDIFATCHFDVGSLEFHLMNNKVVGKFHEDCYASLDELIKTTADECLLIDALVVKELVNNNDSIGLANYLTRNIGEISKINLLLKYAGNACVNYKNSNGRTSGVEAFIQGRTNGKAYEKAYNVFKKKYGGYNEGEAIKDWESLKRKPEKIIDVLTNAGAVIEFEEDSYAEILKSKRNLDILDYKTFTSFYIGLIEYIEKNKIQTTNKIISSIMKSDYSNYSDLSNDNYRFGITDNFLISYALLDLLDVKPFVYYKKEKKHTFGYDIHTISFTNESVYSELIKKETPIRLHIFLSSIDHKGGESYQFESFWTPNNKIYYLNKFNDDIINEVVLDYVKRNPYEYDDYLPILEKYNTNSELIGFFKGIDVSHIKSSYLKRRSKQDIREAIKYIKSKN